MLPANLHRRGYKVQAATSGAQALNLAARRRPDAVILDMGLPDIDGFDVISGLRQWNTSPIIVLSARAAEAGKVAALDAGASDYVTRPCGMDEVLARLRAVLRDTRTSVDDQPVVKTNDFTIDLAHQQVIRGGRAIRLTRTEWQIVALLARHPNQPIPHSGSSPNLGHQRDQQQLHARFHGHHPAQTRTRPDPSPLLRHRTPPRRQVGAHRCPTVLRKRLSANTIGDATTRTGASGLAGQWSKRSSPTSAART